MRLACAAVIVICSALLGLDMRRTLMRRADILGRLCEMCDITSDMISYERTPPDRMIERLGGISMDWQRDCAARMDAGIPMREAVSEAIAESRDIAPLKAEEKALLERFFEQLGSCDAQGELSRIEAIGREFARYRTDAIDECRTKGRLYASCGVLAGIFAAIVLL